MVLRRTQQLRHSNYKVKLTGKGKEKMDVQVCGCADMQMKRQVYGCVLPILARKRREDAK